MPGWASSASRSASSPSVFRSSSRMRTRTPRSAAFHASYASRRPVGSLCRSEEHTSELQSLMRISYAVFCLKKKQTHTTDLPSHTINDIDNNTDSSELIIIYTHTSTQIH